MNNLLRVGRIFTDIIFGLLMVIGIALIIIRVCDIKIMAVKTGSMGEAIPVGALIAVKSCDPSALNTGDVVTFTINEELDTVTHRVISIDTQKQRLVTMGDANTTGSTERVYFKNVVGKVIFSADKLGYFLFFMDTAAGKIFVMCILSLPPILLVAGNNLLKIFQGKEQNDEKNE